MIWLAPVEPLGQPWDWSWSGSGNSIGISQSSHNTPVAPSKLSAPESLPMTRSRSKSEAELTSLKAESRSGSESALVDGQSSESPSTPVTPQRPKKWKSHFHAGTPPPPPPNMVKRTPSVDDKWVYKGCVELVDVQVIVGSALEDERKFEVLSPEGSFVIYAGEIAILASQVTPHSYCILDSEQEREEWASEIRNAKAQLLVSLNITNPNSTLTSSASTNHVRRALQALPYPPSDQRLATVRASTSLDIASASASAHGKVKLSKKAKEKRGMSEERRRKVEHWVPAIWIPDGKTTSCMRCGRTFGWRRRRHHCRLCGRCVCSTCSSRVCFISPSVFYIFICVYSMYTFLDIFHLRFEREGRFFQQTCPGM
jgi:FYVE/RhoGEF/PH domain-containing protein 5/6